jgi:hypothetical protein
MAKTTMETKKADMEKWAFVLLSSDKTFSVSAFE